VEGDRVTCHRADPVHLTRRHNASKESSKIAMKPYPHSYQAKAHGSVTGFVPVSSLGLPDIDTAPPAEFDGPGDMWSPENLLIAAIADCFILTFRGVSRASAFAWTGLDCQVDGILERVSGTTQFTQFTTTATLTVPAGANHVKAKELLERAEKVCLVANSLLGRRTLEVRVIEKNG
jgi:organic hydroperoxide reductase OsmC/OhrA